MRSRRKDRETERQVEEILKEMVDYVERIDYNGRVLFRIDGRKTENIVTLLKNVALVK